MGMKLIVLNVYGSGRSGTTLVGTLLGQAGGVFYAGELQPLWGLGCLNEELCSCGKTVLQCPVWGRCLSELTGEQALSDYAAEMQRLRDATSRARHMLLAPIFRRQTGWLMQQQQYVERTEQLYRTIQAVTGCKVIVDTSKWISYSALMAEQSTLDWRVVHLVRDPRAVAYSWTRRKIWRNQAGSYVRRQGILRTALRWLVQNLLVEVFRTKWSFFLRVRYEDFAREPEQHLGDLLEFVETTQPRMTLQLDEPLVLTEHHIIGANPDRLDRREVTVRLDEEWRVHMPVVQRQLVWLVTAPLALFYGYR